MRVIEAINASLAALMAEDPRVVILGEDVCDPYGGAFKATQGLSSAHPDRVWTTPISEAGIVGVASGLALHGWRPIVEIMFGDFLTLAADQLVNHAAKFAWMYNDQVEVPLIVRTPMGGRRGYGPTHSQSLEKHFCGVPGLSVYAIHPYGDVGAIYRAAYDSRSPCLIIENKVMYARPLAPAEVLAASPRPEVTLVAYGGSVEIAAAAARRLRDDEEVEAEVLAIERLSPFPADRVRRAAERSGCVVAVEEGAQGWGFGSECAHAVAGSRAAFASVAAAPHPVPNSRRLEDAALPSAADVVAAALEALGLAE